VKKGGASSPQKLSAGKAGVVALSIENEADFKKAITDVHNGTAGLNWVHAKYVKKGTIALAGSGKGGIEELAAAIESNNINFGIVRVEEKMDKSTTTKFALIKSVPDEIGPMKKADVGTMSGALSQAFGQAHVSIDICSGKELTVQLVMDKVGSASGTKSHVK